MKMFIVVFSLLASGCAVTLNNRPIVSFPSSNIRLTVVHTCGEFARLYQVGIDKPIAEFQGAAPIVKTLFALGHDQVIGVNIQSFDVSGALISNASAEFQVGPYQPIGRMWTVSKNYPSSMGMGQQYSQCRAP